MQKKKSWGGSGSGRGWGDGGGRGMVGMAGSTVGGRG